MTIRIKKEWLAMLVLIIILTLLFVFNHDPQVEVVADISDNKELAVEEEVNIKVYISGAVTNPGVYEVKNDERLDAVLKLAGGFTDLADTNAINLARHLKDGEMIIVYEKGMEVTYIGIDIFNYGDSKLIESIEGIGEVLASRIILYREDNGFYSNYDDLLLVEGIGDQKLNVIKTSLNDK